MGDRVVFIGDEVTAAGFRLAGIDILVSDSDRAPDAFRHARQTAALVYLTPDVANALPASVLDDALRALDPPVLVIPDIRQRHEAPDIPARVLGLLGLES
jgi:vacuolar-type H+-ATPase subunit F/Vma7